MQSILQPLTDALFFILNWVHGTFGINWGWSIVVLTVIVRIILLPLTYKQFKSMRALQDLQPKIKELQEKYKDNRELMNQKVMEFYRENKVNPFGSCLPLVLQMPVFFALYYMLSQQNTEAFLTDHAWLWISNITTFDLILLFLYVASQFVSSWQMTARDRTQKIMMYSMPIGIGIIMLIGKWPAGLFIYWTTSNLWAIAQQAIIKRTMPPPPALAPAAPAATAPAPKSPGGSSGPSRQRKRSKGKGRKS